MFQAFADFAHRALSSLYGAQECLAIQIRENMLDASDGCAYRNFYEIAFRRVEQNTNINELTSHDIVYIA